MGLQPGDYEEGETVAGRKLLVVLTFVAGVMVAGCGGGASSEGKTLTIGNIGWDENIAVSNLTKVLLEEELGYESVELQMADVGVLFEGVSNGDLDAFQDVWTPIHDEFLNEMGDDVDRLPNWYEGTTKLGLAAPKYMDVTSIEQLNDTEAEEIIGIEPGAVVTERISEEVIPAYDLKQEQIESGTTGMLAEVERRYEREDPLVFLAWSPHWMNQKYDITYLEDPKGAFGDADDAAELSTVTRSDLSEDDPVAYAFLESIRLDAEQLNSLELAINQEGDPIEGVKVWLEDNRDVVQPWVDAAKEAQG